MRLCIIPTVLLYISTIVHGQPRERAWLDSIEKNNPELQKIKLTKKARAADLASRNAPPDLVFAAYYMPFGEHNTTDYIEFEVAQQWEFPTAYAARKNNRKREMQRMDLEQRQLRQKVLLEAQLLVIRYNLMERELNLKNRRQRAFNHGDTARSALARARRKARALEAKHQYKVLESRIAKAREAFVQFNGGKAMDIPELLPEMNLRPLVWEQIWPEIQANDPRLLILEQRTVKARQNLAVLKAENLPGLITGYNFQGFAGNNYHGLYAGLTIPIWGGARAEEAAAINIEKSKLTSRDQIAALKSGTKLMVAKYNQTLKEYREYLKLNQQFKALSEADYNTDSTIDDTPDQKEALALFFDTRLRLLQLQRELLEKRAWIVQYQL